MPAKSKAQQQFMGMVHAHQTGKLKNPSAKVKKVSKNISKSAAKDYAKTKSKNLPKKLGENKNIKEVDYMNPQQQQVVNQQNQVAQKAPVRVAKKKFLEMVAQYNEYGKVLKRAGQLKELGKKLHAMAEIAEQILVQEQGDWFDAHTIKRNIKEMKSYAKGFYKLAAEADTNHNRLTALYDDMGHVLQRYFEIYDIQEPIQEINENCAACEEAPIKEAKVNKIEQLQKIVNTHAAGRVENQWVDTLTARAVLMVHNALSDENKKKYEAMPLMKMVDFAWKHVK